MRDDHAGLAGRQAVECFADLAFTLPVQSRHRLVQDEDRGVADQRARDGDALALPARERGAALTDHGVVAVFQLTDEFVRVRGARRGLDLLRGGPGFPVRDVLADRGAEQDRLLQHQADVAPQRGPAVLPDVAAVDQDRAPLRLVQPQDQAHDRGLAGPRHAHQGEPLAGGDGERDVAQHVPAVAIVERHVPEHDLPREPLGGQRVGPVHDLGLDVEDLGDALGRRHGFGEIGRQLGELADRLVHVRQIPDDQHQIARQHTALEHLERAEQHRGRGAEGGDDLGGAGGGRLEPGHPDALAHRLLGHRVELLRLVALPRERLHQRHRRQHLAHPRRYLPFLPLLRLDRQLGLAVQVQQAVAQERQRGEGDEADLPVDRRQDREHACHGQHIRRELENRVGEHVLQGVRVSGDLGEQVAGARAGVKRERQRLQVREQLAAQRVHHPVADGRRDEDLEVGEQPAEQGDHHDAGRRLEQQRHLSRGQQALQRAQGARHRFVEDDVVEDDLERPRLEQLRRRGAQRAQGGEQQPASHLAQVGEEQVPESCRWRVCHVRSPSTGGEPPPPAAVAAPRVRGAASCRSGASESSAAASRARTRRRVRAVRDRACHNAGSS